MTRQRSSFIHSSRQVREAEQHAEEERRRHEAAETRKIGTALYEKSRAEGSAQESAGASQASGGSDEEVVDAEILDDDTSEAG
ncbi:hypothetical protein ACFYO2_24345 [Streptomyces sp. NPDC006602]|uniref:hypothetical protein n=1 Tax=Streptomyces sp. NPDC006602 TaxID=3364751 RepID=UPI003678E99D